MAKLSGVAVVLFVVVPLCMFTCALLVGIQLGRALERRPGSVVVTLKSGDARDYVVVAEELWDTDISGRGRDESASRHPCAWWVPLPLESSATTPNPKAQGCNRNYTSVSAFQLAKTLRDRIAAQEQMLMIQKQQHLMLQKLRQRQQQLMQAPRRTNPPEKQAAASQQVETTRIAVQEQLQQIMQQQEQQLMQAPRRTNPPDQRNQRRARDERSSMQSKHPYTSRSAPLPPEINTVTPKDQGCNRNHTLSQQLRASRIAEQERRQILLMQKQQQLMLAKLRQQQLMQAQRGTNPPENQGSKRPPDVFRRGRDEISSTQSKHPNTSRSTAPLPLESSTVTSEAQRRNRNITSPRGVNSAGPWGGSGGQPFYMDGGSAPRLRSIILYHSCSVIHSLACEYSLAGDEAYRMAGPWGRPYSFDSTGLLRATIILSAGEHVTAVEGTIGLFSDVPGSVITSLTFRTSHGRRYGPYGNKAGPGAPRGVVAMHGASIVGFWGRSGWLLDAIGVYIRPRSNPASRNGTCS